MSAPGKLHTQELVLLALLFVLNLIVLGIGIGEFLNEDRSPLVLAMGIVGISFAIALMALLLAIRGSATAGASATPATADETVAQKEMLELLRSMNDRMLISDMAKRIAYRDNDREALRKAIREDIERRDYDAAMVLVSEMSRSYGYRLEAEQFREEIEAARESELNQRITQSVAGLDQLLAQHQWDRAREEAEKIKRLFPDSQRVQELSIRIQEARDDYKKELQQQFLDAAQREDNDLAMELLKELDQYLTREEAGPFMETANQVITKIRQNLGLQFKLACTDKDWNWAVKVGRQLLAQFPNSKMAEEVKLMMPELEKRISGKGADQPLG